jgi:hypothetical protein
MAITRWDPFREVSVLQNRLNSLFRDFNEGDSPLTTASFVPAVDIYEALWKLFPRLHTAHYCRHREREGFLQRGRAEAGVEQEG